MPTAEKVLTELSTVYYAHRSLAAVLAAGRRCGADEFGPWFTARLSDDRHFGDLKRCDALRSLNVALALDGLPTVPVSGLTWSTRHFQRWANTFTERHVDGVRLNTRHRVAYQQYFDPDFARLWWGHLNSAGAGGLPYTLACAVIRPETDLTDAMTLARLVAHETVADRAAVARYLALNEETARLHRGFFPEGIKDGVARRILDAVWFSSLESLDEEARARGFPGAREAVDGIKVFVLGFLRDQGAGR